jgi:hypothetical protein
MKKILLFSFVFSFVFSFETQAQIAECENKVEEIYSNIIKSIGNSFPPQPALRFLDSKSSVAYSSGKEIVLEYEIINSLCGNPNFEDKISYIISHELAHHYLNHTWMFNTGFAYSSPLGEFINSKSSSYEQRELSEIQADIFGGFFGQISGYKTLSFAEDVLKHIYKTYNLSNDIDGYPSLKDRILIVDRNIEKVKNLELLFNVGNILQLLGEYDHSNRAFNDIILNNFNSREIYNNLGLNYLMRIIEIHPLNISRFSFPTSLDLNTRASISSNRSIDSSTDIDYLYKKSFEFFNLSIKLDSEYKPPIQNLLVLNYIKEINSNRKDALTIIENSNLNNIIKNDLMVINYLLNGQKSKAKKLSAIASEISLNNLNNVTNNFSNNYRPLLDQLELDIKDFILGFDNSKTIRTDNGETVIKKSHFGETEIYKIGKKIHIIITPDELINQENYQLLNYKGKTVFIVNPTN